MINTDGTPTIACSPPRLAPPAPEATGFDLFLGEPDLERSAGDGFKVRLYLVPDLDCPERAIVEVVNGLVVLDQLDVTPSEGLEAYRHTALYSNAYAEGVR